MLFNTIDFALFLPVVFALYWGVGHWGFRAQNWLLLIASYVFYAWWDWRFVSLIVLSTAIDFAIASKLQQTSNIIQRKLLLGISLLANLGLLAFFKYANFFLESFQQAFSFLGLGLESWALQVILPVGISFYTFQTLSYTIDVYRRKIAATDDLLGFACFVGFFPQLVAGPIERAGHLLPQLLKPRKFMQAQAVEGMRQILWGLFKKMVIADNCAKYVNMVFAHDAQYSSSALALAAILLSIQIYGDFSGYSDIAIGTSKLFGIHLNPNFAFPYFAQNIGEFWRRWHISLSNWFRDYVYIPLGGNRKRYVLNLLLVFVLSGLWHGAQWTFVVWGLIHAMFYLLWLGYRKIAKAPSNKFQSVLYMLATYTATTCAWVVFRASNLTQAMRYFEQLFTKPFLIMPEFVHRELRNWAFLTVLLSFFIIAEWWAKEQEHVLQALAHWPKWKRWLIYGGLVLLIFLFTGKEQSFIYFQF